MKWKNLIMSSVFLLSSCVGSIGAGSLGGWKTIVFPVDRKEIKLKIDLLYLKYPTYKVPDKWQYEKEYWKRAGYEVLRSEFFYFKNGIEEMYYVTYIGAAFGVENSKVTKIAIRAVYTKSNGWKENEKYSDKEKARIDKRFNNEIISKLEKYTKTKSYSE